MLPDDPERTRHELILQLRMGELLMAAKDMGDPEAGEAYSGAHVLCQELGEPPQRCQALSGLIIFHATQGRLDIAQEFGQQLFGMALRHHDPVLRREANIAMGVIAFYRGDLIAATAYLEQSLEIFADPSASTSIVAGGLSPRIASRIWLARALWVLGYAEQARQCSQEALALARDIRHAPSFAYVVYFAAMLSQQYRDAAATQAHADALRPSALRKG